MEFLKRHLFFVICGAGGAAGIALGVTGLQAMPKVVNEMKAAEGVYRNLESLQSKPVNEAVINAEEDRIESIKSDRDKVLAKAADLYKGFQPLVDGAFPDGPPLSRIEFRTKYHAAMKELLAKLNSGGPAAAADVEMMRRRIEDEKAEASRGGDAVRELAAELSAPTKNAAGVVTRAGVRQDAKVRADIAAAQRIYCYAVDPFDEKPPERVSSLDFVAPLKDTGTVDAPYPDEIWRGQVGLWVQEYLLDAIADINNEAAEEAKTAGVHAWVGTMPVKEVISIRLARPDLYVPPEGGLYAVPEPGGYNEAVPAGTAETVYTHSASGPYFEVVQVTAKLVMDQRDISKLIARICNNSFFTLVRAAYKEVPPNPSLMGKIYGSEPTVNVVLEFEFIMLGEVFRKWIPQEVCEKYNINCPQPADGS